ncbi:hypothetical protein LVD15_13355 [Fulvivirga maritima]|uniref:hypothetical protein n=1 Tax=Fulvivirga maritima TaxID=2904247 RepID=UPI001F3D9E8A|nr:hypothetical protein [Fulvivirga maritima]UII29371.1 hypothetical protein LVD15_13355 [Fulvivirga maritima]
MPIIKNIDSLTADEIHHELQNGAKFVKFQYCISIIILTFKNNSDIYFIKAGESTTKHSISFICLSVLLGWWGLPWGPLYTIKSLYINLKGGTDITQELLSDYTYTAAGTGA